MFNYVEVELPNNEIQLERAYKATHYQRHYHHDYTRIYFRDWNVKESLIKPGTPIIVTIAKKKFHGYIHDVKSFQDNNRNFTEVGIIGPSYVMRQSSQTIYKNVTADQVIVKIARKYGFAFKVTPHPRVYPQISQAGLTDWELMVKLAKQCGYFLRAENTELYFQPFLQEFKDYLGEALSYEKNDAGFKSLNALYSFRPIIGETLSSHDADKYATSIAGIDPRTGRYFKYTKQDRHTPTRHSSQPELFDKHATNVVVNDYTTATQEAASASDRSLFAYQAEAEIIGNSSLHPGLPIHLDFVGAEYSGYWTILGIEHTIVEEKLNAQIYTCIITVGTDSLGELKDDRYPKKPGAEPVRNIAPDMRNSRVKPTTEFRVPVSKLIPTTASSIAPRVNRAAPIGNSVSYAAWKSSHDNLNPPVRFKSLSPIAIDKRRAHAQRN